MNVTSLLVPSVQELIKENKDVIPPRYIISDQEQLVTPDHLDLPEIPTISMKSLLSEESMDSELAKLDHACREWGFFQLVDHGVSKSLVEKMKTEAHEIFNLPMEEKKKFWRTPTDVEGFGQSFVVSEEQKLDWGDRFYLRTLPTNLRKPHLLPCLPLPFRDTLENYSKQVQSVAKAVLAQIAKAVNMEASEMENLFENGTQSLRMNYYPPCPQPEKVIGLRPHSDSVGLTILLQVNEVEGLQIRKDGMWVPVKPLPDAFIVNIGDILEIVTNGTYRSIEHRATVNAGKERLSIAAFHSPRRDGVIGPAPSLISEQTPAKFRSVTAAEYFRGLFARELDGKSYIDCMRISSDNN